MASKQEQRQKRKEEGKLKKRRRIEESGGVRPRASNDGETKTDKSLDSKPAKSGQGQSRNTQFQRSRPNPSHHRFGRVMQSVPCRNRPRFSTVSIAVPGSVLANCQTKELKTLMVGQIARAATIYHVDEIIVFDDKLGTRHQDNHHRQDWRKRRDQTKDEDTTKEKTEEESNHDEERERRPRSTHEEFMARLLQYCECPQYLRRNFFPMHPDLQFAGLLAPIDAPHHVRAEDHSPYREGVVLSKQSKDGSFSLVNCGVRSRPIEYVCVCGGSG